MSLVQSVSSKLTRPVAERKVAFAAIPHALAEDSRLTLLDLAVIRCLLRYARQSERCWVFVGVIADTVRRSERSVQLSLRRLERTGWLRQEPASNPSGREFILVWREAQPVAPLPPQPAAPLLAQPAALNLKKTQEEKQTGEVVALLDQLQAAIEEVPTELRTSLQATLRGAQAQYPIDRLRGALRATHTAWALQQIRTTPSQYFCGVLEKLAYSGAVTVMAPSPEQTSAAAAARAQAVVVASQEKQAAKQRWLRLSAAEQEALRRETLQALPWLRRHPTSLDDWCLSRLTNEDTDDGVAGTARMATLGVSDADRGGSLSGEGSDVTAAAHRLE